MYSSSNRVVITGLGAVCCAGGSLPALWRSILEGRSGISTIEGFDTSEMETRIGGEIKQFDLHHYIDGSFPPKRVSRQTQLAVAATHMAVQDAGLSPEQLNQDGDLPIYLGIGTSSLGLLETGVQSLHEKGPKRVSSYLVGSSTPHSTASFIAKFLGIDTRLTTYSTACASAVVAFGHATERIRHGQADLVFAGGTDAPLTPFGLAGFCTSRMMSTRNDDPAHASRPFDLRRDGGLLAEGSGMLVLENYDHARARGATLYAEVLGAGMNSDTPGAQPATGLQDTMKQALDESAMRPEHMDMINAHGTSDVVMDQMECEAIQQVFKQRGGRVPTTSVKAITGNPLAAGGALQLITSCKSIQEEIIPKIANYEFQDPNCDGDLVTGEHRRGPVRNVMVNAHGFGGVNVSQILSRPEP